MLYSYNSHEIYNETEVQGIITRLLSESICNILEDRCSFVEIAESDFVKRLNAAIIDATSIYTWSISNGITGLEKKNGVIETLEQDLNLPTHILLSFKRDGDPEPSSDNSIQYGPTYTETNIYLIPEPIYNKLIQTR